MRVSVQHTLATPRDWIEVDSADWSRVAAKSEPSGGETIDEVEGWIYTLSVQAVTFNGFDHYHVEHVDAETCRVTAWNDDPVDWPVGSRGAHVWTFRNLSPDPTMGGAINTQQTRVVYADPELGVSGALPWDDFTPPTRNVRHGISVDEELSEAHRAALTKKNWRDWTEGLDAKELDEAGRLKSQQDQGRYKVPDGTKTYNHNSTSIAGVHTVLSGNAWEMDDIGVASIFLGGNLGINDEEIYGQHTTPTGEPDSAAWPTGTYRVQLDVIQAGTGVTYNYADIGAASGHFARINAAASSDLETKQGADADESGTGLKLFTTGSVSWTAGAAGDRFEVLLAAARDGVGHGNQDMDFNISDVDTFADGPWSAGGLVDIAAQSDGVSTVTADLSVDTAIAAQSDGVSSVAAALSVRTQLAATVAAVSTVTIPNFVVRVEIAAQSDATSTVAAAVSVGTALVGSPAGLSALSVALSIDTAIAAQSDAQSSVAASLSVRTAIAAQSDATSTVAADLTVAAAVVDIAAQSDATSTVTAALSVGTSLVAASAAVATVSGSLSVATQLAAASVGVSSVSGSLSVATPIAAQSDATSTVAADLSVSTSLVAAAAGVSSVSAILSVRTGLVSTTSAVSTVAAALSVRTALATQSDGVSTVVAALSVVGAIELAAVSAGVSSVAAVLSVGTSLVSVATGQSAVTAALSVRTPLSAVSAGVSTVVAALTVSVPVVDLAAVSTVAADLSVQTPALATVVAQSTVVASLSVRRGIDAAVAGVSSVASALSVRTALAAVVTAQSTVTAALLDAIEDIALEVEVSNDPFVEIEVSGNDDGTD